MAKPLTKPPAKAASTNRGKTNPSIVAPQKEVTSTWMEIPSGGEAAGPQGRQTNRARSQMLVFMLRIRKPGLLNVRTS